MALTGNRAYIQAQVDTELKAAIEQDAAQLGISAAILAGRILAEAKRRFVVSDFFLQETKPYSSTYAPQKEAA